VGGDGSVSLKGLLSHEQEMNLVMDLFRANQKWLERWNDGRLDRWKDGMNAATDLCHRFGKGWNGERMERWNK
jgi:hypothetical protein